MTERAREGNGAGTRQTSLFRERPRESDLSGWVLRGGVAGFFLLMGAEKFASTPGSPWVGMFQQIGLGQWFRYFTGVIEVGGGLLYFFPRTNLIGATLLVCTMVGAIVVHIAVRHSVGASLYPAVLLFAVVAIAFRRPE